MTEDQPMTTQNEQIGQDLQFVKQALAKRASRGRMPSIIGVFWAAYILIGYPMLDLNPDVQRAACCIIPQSARRKPCLSSRININRRAAAWRHLIRFSSIAAGSARACF